MKKEVDFVVSNTYMSSFYAVLDKIADIINKDKFQNIILVVPDKFSMNAEQLVFEYLNTSSLFNVWTTTLSRLEKKVLLGYENGLNVLTKQSGTLLVGKIVLQNADKLLTYKKVCNQFAFAENMFNTINLLKSSGITPDELLLNIDNSNFGNKIKDIYTIYNEYEKALGKDNLDTVTRYELFDKVSKNNEYIKKSDVFFAMFDSFTNAQISLLTNLSQTAKSLTVGCCYNVLQGNKNIYDNVVFQRLNNAFENCGIKTKISFKNAKLNPLQNFLLNNLYNFDNKLTFETNKVKVIECESIEQELRYVASKIKYLALEKNYKFDDINVAINGIEDYSLLVQQIFAEYDIPYFLDITKTLNDHYFIKTIALIFDFITDKNLTVDAVSISQSPLFDIDAQNQATFENFCYKYNVIGDEFYRPFNFENSNECAVAEETRKQIFDNILKLKNNLENSKNFAEIIDNLICYLQDIQAKETIENYSQQQDNVECAIDNQVYDKFLNLLSEAESVFANDKVDVRFAIETLKSGFNSVKLSSIPINCNSVFVGDCSKSTFITKKALFIVGATQSRMPIASVDAGTITDDEIQNFKSKNKITPSIKEINKREKFKLFNLLLNFTDMLELTYSLLIKGQVQFASDFANKLCDILTFDGKKLPIDSYNQIPLLIFDDEQDSLLPEYYVGTVQNATRIAKSQKQENQTIKYMLCQNMQQTLKEQEKLYLKDEKRFVLKNAKEVLFPNGLTKVSQIESYFNCPFKQFVDYGIRPQIHQKFELKAVDVGNILHKIAQLFIDDCIKNDFKNIDAKNLATKYFDKVINSNDYKNLKEKKYELNSLKQEAVRFCCAIKYQIDSSDYRPKKSEFKFENYNLPSGLTLKGFVDRLDICDANNTFKIVDYKTGNEEFSYQNAYYGLKIQLVTYLKVLQDILAKRPAGAMYMPVKNKFSDKETTEYNAYKLSGVLLNDQDVIFRTDKHLVEQNSSDIINVAFTKERDINKNSLKLLLSNQEMQELIDYCYNILNGAVDEMLNGYILPKPYKEGMKNSCEYCDYKSLCQYDIMQNGCRVLNEKKDKLSFIKDKNGEQSCK
ncbi:MAG: PD-(D/E)XK nuclease family protein [Christensenellales bacterium]